MLRPVRVDEEEYVGGVMDKIIALIRDSRFVVADLSFETVAFMNPHLAGQIILGASVICQIGAIYCTLRMNWVYGKQWAWTLISAGIACMLVRTIVIMMGMSNLGKNMQRLVTGGMDPRTPVTVIEKGSTPEQRVVSAEITRIDAECRSQGISSPAVIVVGRVAALCRTLGDLS